MPHPNDCKTTPCAAAKVESVKSSLGGLKPPQYRLLVTHDMDGHFVKADSVVEFLDAFLPYPSTAPKRRTRRKNPFEGLVDADKWVEAEVVVHFTKAVTSQKLCPKLVLSTSEHTPDPKGVDNSQQKLDAGFFHPDDAPTNGEPGWPFDLVLVEFKNRKRGDVYDPLNDKAEDEEFKSPAETRKEVRGQLTTYSELGYELQHRVFLIMLLIIGRRYRLMRWDRAGTVVTPSIDYYENPDDLCEFLWRISHVGDKGLGLDPTAVRLKGDDFDELDTIAKPLKTDVDHTPRVLKERELTGKFCYRYVREMFAASIQDRALPRYKLHISMGDVLHTFLVGKPVAIARGMVGRGTRGWVAWHCEGGCFVWLKDAWRVSFEKIEREGDILARLNRAKIPNVPTLVCHGDVAGQTTVTADWWKRKNPSKTATPVVPTPTTGEPSSAEQAEENSRKRKRPHEDEDNERPSQPSLRQRPRRACRGGERLQDAGVTVETPPSARAGPADPAPDETLTDPSVYVHGCHIKRHTHYRMAVKEVGMPLKDFMNGRQLAAILSDCIVAHHHAATSRSLDVRILHRDISDKNILIYPKVVRSSNRARILAWGGLLTDWEISKPIPKFGVEERARQPQRTGRWQFMAANLLMNPSQRVMIEDELESFFHILVYYAVRYLKSTLSTDDDAAHFLESCFDCFTMRDEDPICGNQKLYLVQDGDTAEIIFLHPVYMNRNRQRPITFGSDALNALIATLIPCMRARYKVLTWDNWLKTLPEDHWAHPHSKGRFQTPAPSSRSDAEDGDHGAVDPRDDANTDQKETMAAAPTEKDRKVAMKIAKHTFFRKEFQSALDKGPWKDDDKLGDRVPSDYVCHFPVLSSIPKGRRGRSKAASPAAGVSSE